MADIIKLIKKQSAQRVAELRELSGKLSEQLGHLIHLIPEDTRQKSVEDFLNGIRESVLGETPRKYKRRAKKAAVSAPKRAGKTKAGKGAGRRGRKKKETAPATEEQKQA